MRVLSYDPRVMRLAARFVTRVVLLLPLLACPSVRQGGEGSPEGGAPESSPPSDARVSHDGQADAARDAGPTDAPGDAVADGMPCDGDMCGVETLVQGLSQATLVRVDNDNIYFGDEGSVTGFVYQCPKTGCKTPTTLGPGFATGMGLDSKNVYWNDFEGGNIVSCTIGGCASSPTVIASDQTEAEGVSFDGTNLYWATEGTIATCVAPGCPAPSMLATGQSTTITQLGSENNVGYWISKGSVLGCAAKGCASSPTVVTSPSAPGSDLVVKNGFVYFTSGNAVISCPTTSTCAIPQTVGSSFEPYGLGTDGLDVYWLDNINPGVYRCPVDGCGGGAAMFATTGNFSQPGANVALDGEYAYWTDAQGVYRKHK
jgi:hypothetical protein